MFNQYSTSYRQVLVHRTTKDFYVVEAREGVFLTAVKVEVSDLPRANELLSTYGNVHTAATMGDQDNYNWCGNL